ncbi:DUF6388 family protein [Undibacterium sp. Ji49W]|uniref:DUF6388 family protein n=1 Tax=Undibacterium sp. Ji49W TaxID=3413040 RepID=UPI003BF2E542
MEENRKSIAYTRFLNKFPAVKKSWESISEQEANILGLAIDDLRKHAVQKAMANEAKN